MVTRRSFLATMGSAASLLYMGCGGDSTAPLPTGPSRLVIDGRSPSSYPALGVDVLYGPELRRAYLRVPQAYTSARAWPLAIAFHGNAGRGDDWTTDYGALLAAAGCILLAPNSLGITWDALTLDGFGEDVAFTNDVIAQTLDRCRIDRSRISLLGFSDGATYALSLGLSNGDLTHRVIAHSPGYYVTTTPHGQPSFFVSHGIEDGVLPIDQTSRVIVPQLRAMGDTVTYVEFEGGHQITPDVADQAVAWVTS